jgi:N-acetylmuramoyl-L-alanine amidase
MIVLHYTGMRDNEAAIRQLCTPASEVSAHYVVLQDGCIVQLVAEPRRAWHAGVSSWAGGNDINSRSIGIEIANPGHDHGYPDFPKRQIAAVTALCRSIFTRHQIPADRVLAHSDVAPARKQDPGEKFPWKVLADSGIGIWVNPAPVTQTGAIYVLGETNPAIEEIQRLLARYGYGVTPTGYLDGITRDAVAAFQRHFRPIRVDGVVDVSTTATLKALLAARNARLSSIQPS